MTDPRVKIIALCKDEAYFLPQWVHHYFHFGANAVELYINRITDNTVAILDKLQTRYSGLKYYSWDWYDIRGERNKGPQQGAMLFAYQNSKKDADYVLFVDLDEYWLPANFTDTLPVAIEKLGHPDVVTFAWYNLDGLTTYALPLLSRKKLRVSPLHLSKTLMATSLHLIDMTCHKPVLHKNDIKWVNGNGEPEIPDLDQPNLCAVPKALTAYFILHDWMQSPFFYLSRLIRGTPNMPRYFFERKMTLSRPAFNTAYANFPRLEIEVNLPLSYYTDFADLINELGLAPLLNQALEKRLLQALESLRLYKLGRPSLLESLFQGRFTLAELESHLANALIELNPDYQPLLPTSVLTPADCVTDDPEQTRINFDKAMRVYPYALEQSDWPVPLFPKAWFAWLLERGEYETA